MEVDTYKRRTISIGVHIGRLQAETDRAPVHTHAHSCPQIGRNETLLRWLDGGPAAWTHFGLPYTDTEGNDCAAVDQLWGGQWVMDDCLEPRPFICKRLLGISADPAPPPAAVAASPPPLASREQAHRAHSPFGSSCRHRIASAPSAPLQSAQPSFNTFPSPLTLVTLSCQPPQPAPLSPCAQCRRCAT